MDERILQDVIYVSSGSDSGISSSKPTTSLWASGKKRRVSSDQESPRKRLRKAKEPIEEVPEARGSKRKATDMVVDTDSSFSIDDSAIMSVKDASGAVIVIESSDSDTKPVMASKKRARTEEPDASISSSRNNNSSSSSSSSSSTSTSNSSSRSNNSRSNSSNNSSSRGNNNSSSSNSSSSRKANTVSVEDTKVLPGSFGDSTTSTPTNSQRGGNDEGLVGTVQATSEEAEEDGSGAVIVIESSDSDTKPVMASKKRARNVEPDASINNSNRSSSSSSNSSSSSSSNSSTSNSNNNNSSSTSNNSSSSSSSTSNSNNNNSSSNSNSNNNSNSSSSSKANTVSVEDTKVLPGSFGDSTTSTPTNSQRGGNGEGLVGTVQETSEEAEEDGSDDFEDKYEQLQQLGKGGFGCVYAGTRKADGLPVAIKRIRTLVKRQSMLINGRRRSLPTEVFLMMKAAGGPETAGKSAAVSLLDFYDRKGELIIVMERPVPSQDLRRYRFENKGPLEENLAKNIMKQLVDAAIDMHSKGILHRDIKLSNLLIETGSAQPRVRVIDFGCGCILSRKPYSTFSGTRAYTPPEYFTKLKYRAGPTTVWQLGSVLYEILDGARNFNTLKFCCVGVSIGSRFSKDCHDFLRACLMTNPEKRATLEQLHQHPWLM